MTNTKRRLEAGFAILALLDRRRQHNRLTGISPLERAILNRELRDLELEILSNPGALADERER